MPTLHVAKRWLRQARQLLSSRRQRLALAGFLLLLACSLAVGGAVLHQQRHQVAQEVDDGEIEMEIEARGARQRPVQSSRPAAKDAPTVKEARADAAAHARPVGSSMEVRAAWYDVPNRSLAKRRAEREELTAAHNRLAIGTLVRVTHLSNGKSTLVRITDRGIRDKRIELDVCREAAEQLGMVSTGIARVKMEIVREENGSSSLASRKSAPRP